MTWINLSRRQLALLAGAPTQSQRPDPREGIRPPVDTRYRTYYNTSGIGEIFVSFGLAGGGPLDYCFESGVRCGKPAADAFCHERGYRTATIFKIQPNVGRTAIFSDHSICESPVCGTFESITCVGTATVFETPWIDSLGHKSTPGGDARLDWCRDWATNCGKPAADAYCHMLNFSQGSLRLELA